MGNDARVFGCELRQYDSIDSTNREAGDWGRQGAPHGALVVAESQTAGHGRKDRIWHSPKGDNIYMTLILRPEIKPENASMLTLVMGLAVAKAIEQKQVSGVSIKWPNDILINGRKVCGILTGAETNGEKLDFVYIGVGVNVNGTDFPEDIKDKATSLKAECGLTYNKEELMWKILDEFSSLYTAFLRGENLGELKDEYNERLINAGRQVKILGRVEYEGEAIGINERGELIVRQSCNIVSAIMSGEVSVRGVDGYF